MMCKKIKNISISVTDNCFFKCEMCSMWKNKSKTKLPSLKQYDLLFKDLQKIQTKSLFVSFTGGEPLIVPGIYELIKLANKYNFLTNLNTNGWLINNKIIKKLFDSGLDFIVFSVDGSTAKLHDKIRGVAGSYEKIFWAIKNLKNYYKMNNKSIQVEISTVINALNLHDIENIVNLAEKNKNIGRMKFQSIASSLLTGNDINEKSYYNFQTGKNKYWFENESYKHLWPTDKKRLLDLFTNLIILRRKSNKFTNSESYFKMQHNYFLHPEVRMSNITCSVNNNLNIFTNGDILHCCPKHEVIGNICDNRLKDLLKLDDTKRFLNNIKNCNLNCHHLINCIPEN